MSDQHQVEGTGQQAALVQVCLVQAASSLDPAENRARMADLVARAVAEVDVAAAPTLVVLPEAFARDFGKPDSSLAPYAEPLDGPFATAVADAARTHGVHVLAGMFRRVDRQGAGSDKPVNTLVLRGPDGEQASYDKIHLYDSFGYRESDRLLPGGWTPVVVELGGLRVGLMTCYDLRFPELARALVDAGAEVLVLPAAWVAGERKVDHWRTLVRARAIENTTYVVAVGQPAPRYTGHSTVVSPLGDVLLEAGDGEELLHAVLEQAEVVSARAVNPSLANRRG